MNDRPYRMPTAVGERRGSAWADLFACAAVFLTSIIASEVVALMTHRLGTPAFSGFMAIIGWGWWLLNALHLAAYLSPPWHPSPLTAYGWQVVWGIGATWATGAFVAVAGWVWISRVSEPDSQRDVREMVDSARIAGEQDYHRGGFIAK
jgi:hypothetical protein